MMKFLEVVVVVVDKDVDEGEYAVVVQNVVLYLDHLSKMIFGVADGKVMVVMVVNFFPNPYYHLHDNGFVILLPLAELYVTATVAVFGELNYCFGFFFFL